MTVPTTMTTGDEFELFAHRWRVIGKEPKRRSTVYEDPEQVRGLICRQVAAKR
jgi:hypothetical protein